MNLDEGLRKVHRFQTIIHDKIQSGLKKSHMTYEFELSKIAKSSKERNSINKYYTKNMNLLKSEIVIFGC